MTQEPIILGQLSIAALLLVFISCYVNHLLANTREQTKIRREQGHILSMAFEPELQAFISTNDDCRLILTDEAYQRHEAAVRIFSRFLSWIDKVRLRLLWYRLAKFNIGKKRYIPFYEQYADCDSLNKRREVRPIVMKRIQDIISYAIR